MQLPDIISLLLLKVFVKGHTLCNQVVEPKIEDDLNKLAGEGLAFYNFLNAGSGHTNFMLEFFKLLLEFLYVVAFLFLVEDVVLVVSEDLQQQR